MSQSGLGAGQGSRQRQPPRRRCPFQSRPASARRRASTIADCYVGVELCSKIENRELANMAADAYSDAEIKESAIMFASSLVHLKVGPRARAGVRVVPLLSAR